MHIKITKQNQLKINFDTTLLSAYLQREELIFNANDQTAIITKKKFLCTSKRREKIVLHRICYFYFLIEHHTNSKIYLVISDIFEQFLSAED